MEDRRGSLEDQIEIERDRRRRVVAALTLGAEARADTPPPSPWGPLVTGLALAIFVALVVAVGTLVRASVSGATPSPGVTPTVAVSSR